VSASRELELASEVSDLETRVDDLTQELTQEREAHRVTRERLAELQEHWDGCAGAEATINDWRARAEKAEQERDALTNQLSELRAQLVMGGGTK
jgi:chromosome segregation ATPase